MKRLLWVALIVGLVGCTGSGPAQKPDRGPSWGQTGKAPVVGRAPEAQGQAAPDPALVALEEELARHMAVLGQADPPAYFIGYTLTEQSTTSIQTSVGSLVGQQEVAGRWLDIEVRVGDYQLDNTNRNRGGGGGFASRRAPLDSNPEAVRLLAWQMTEEAWRSAAEAYFQVQANEAVSVEEEDRSGTFTREEPQVHLEAPRAHDFNLEVWVPMLKAWSAPFRQEAGILDSGVSMRAVTTNTFMVNSEGTKLQHGDQRVLVSVEGQALADDGMELVRYESAFARRPEGLPDDQAMLATVGKVIDDLKALRDAPVVEPWVGPVILSGRAAGVFFHEIFGHRIEGHRQRDEQSGQTFTNDLGVEILPPFLSVIDDPTAFTYQDRELAGYYRFDDEGVPAQPVTLIEDGKLRTFLTSRLPLESVSHSNGHGRRQIGRSAVARQGNLMVTPSRTVPIEELRQMLIAELVRQDKPFGYLFEDISGGFTNTQRYNPQAFKVTPLMVYRIYADGRPDELVRGVDIAGTPKTVFKKIIAAADDFQVFNGYCGAESGWVPVSASSPSLLLSEVEIEKKAKSPDKGPVLPAPPMDSVSSRQEAAQ